MERPVGIPAPVIHELRDVVEEKRRNSWLDRLYERLWITRYSDSKAYSQTYVGLITESTGVTVINPNTLHKLIKQKREETGLPLVLDLMSYGGLVSDLAVVGCSVGLTDKRPSHRRRLDETLGNGFIDGDIRSAKTWRRIESWLGENGNGRKFDVITCRPAAGLDAVPQNETYYRYAFKKLYSLLSERCGHLFLELDEEMFDFVKSAQLMLEEIPGIEAYVEPKTEGKSLKFFLVKHPNATDEIE